VQLLLGARLAVLASVFAAMLSGLFWKDLMMCPLESLLTKSMMSFLFSLMYIPLLFHTSKNAVEHSEGSAQMSQPMGRTHSCIIRRSNLARLAQLTLRAFTLEDKGSKVGDRQHCSICLSEFDIEDKLLQLSCGHTYHEPCVLYWFLSGGSCPLRCEAPSSHDGFEAPLAGGTPEDRDEHAANV
jgi:hypothetical protein